MRRLGDRLCGTALDVSSGFARLRANPMHLGVCSGSGSGIVWNQDVDEPPSGSRVAFDQRHNQINQRRQAYKQ